MGAGDRLLQILPDTVERQLQGRPPADQNIVMTGLEASAAAQSHRLAQPPPDAIALDGITHFLGHRETDAGGALILAFEGLQNESRRRNLDAGRGGQKIRPLPQTLHRSRADAARVSGAEALAAAGAASGNDLAAALGGHASAKTVTALPHELARLIGPFHGSGLRWSRRNAGCCRVPSPELVSPAFAGAPASNSGGLIRETGRFRQCKAVLLTAFSGVLTQAKASF